MNAAGSPRLDLGPLREKFLGRAREDSLALLHQCELLASDDAADRPQSLSTMASLLHRLSGTAGTFGFNEIGAKARELGQITASMLAAPDVEPGSRLDALAGGLRAFADAVEHCQKYAAALAADSAEAAALGETSSLVCVVADEPTFTAQLAQVLEGFGYRVARFASIAELDEHIEHLVPAAVVARLERPEKQLPGLRSLRNRQNDPAPVMVVARRAEFSDYLDAVRAGADGYFVEPLDLPRMEARLHYLIERRRRDGLRVMLVDDDLDLLAACGKILESANMVVGQVSDPSRALAALSDFRPELILMDIRMPQCTGPELAQVIRMNEEWLHVPIVYMSTESQGEDQLLATRNAGEAFLAKPINPKQLLATVSANGRRARQMLETASKDTLTGVLKHSFIKEHLAAELERAQRTNSTTSAVMIDIDNFKSVNDLHGHLVGDVVIRTLSNILRQRLRVIDGIGRMGGEEFLSVLANCDTEEATEIINGVRERFQEVDFAGKDGVFHVSFSAGVAEATGSRTSVTELLAAADDALYVAKKHGRNRVVSAEGLPTTHRGPGAHGAH